MNDETKIAGDKTVLDWKKAKQLLGKDPNEENWETIFDDFLTTRINTRYLDPIDAISNISAQEGKGFSIVAIYCSLIEFFETLIKGYGFDSRNYVDQNGQIIRSAVKRNPKGVALPLSTKEIFVNFLTENEPFDTSFNATTAESFYYNVRCAILHQAETGPGWYVKDGKSKKSILEASGAAVPEITLHWKLLKKAFDDFITKTYKTRLLKETDLQANFIFKWDNICQ